MIPYWVLFGIFAFAALPVIRDSRTLRLLLILSGLLLIIAIGLRREVGGDWQSYELIFRRLQFLEANQAIALLEPAYSLINWIVGRSIGEVWGVNLICAAIFTYGFLQLCRSQPDPMLAVLIGIPYLVIVVAMGYTRQSAALGLVMAALSQYLRGSITRTAICLALAVAFHRSAIIVIPMIALSASRRRFTTVVFLGFAAATTYYLIVSSYVDILYKNYIDARYSSSGAAIRIVMNLVPAAILLAYSNRFSSDRQERRLWLIFSLASFVALVLLFLTSSSAAVDRVSLYLIPLQIFVLSRLPSALAGQHAAHIGLKLGVIYYSAAVQFVWLNYADHASAWLPYQSFLVG